MRLQATTVILGALAIAGFVWYKNMKESEKLKDASASQNPNTSAAAPKMDSADRKIVYLSDLAKSIGQVVNSYSGGSPKPTTLSDLNKTSTGKTQQTT